MVKQTEDTVWVKTARVKTASQCTTPIPPASSSKNYPWLVLSQPGPLCDNISTSDSTAERAGQQGQVSILGRERGKNVSLRLL